MSVATNQVQLLREDFKKTGTLPNPSAPIRPPWALSEPEFQSLCTQCGDCISHCPTQIIKKGEDGFPIVNFSQNECNYCQECVEHCDAGALADSNDYPEKRPWDLQVTIDESCLGRDNVICQSCSDSCGFVAISFVAAAPGIDRPVINEDLCNGCGACVSVCPENAIGISNKA